MTSTPLADAFVAQLNAEQRAGYAALAELESRLGAALHAAQSAWPQLALPAERYLQHLARHAPADRPAEELFTRLHPADLYLALGCVMGNEAAIHGFHAQFGPDLEIAIRRFHNLALGPDDLRQALHEKLLVGRGGRPAKLADYAGLGFLQNWIRVTAVRALTDLARGAKRRKETAQEDLSRFADDDDLEISFLKKHYRREFKQAFEVAVRSLTSRERNLLRHNVAQSLTIDQIAALYGIHRATAARRLAKAREALLEATRKQLMERLRVGRDEFDSLMHLIGSHLDVSICRVLRSESTNAATPATVAQRGDADASADDEE